MPYDLNTVTNPDQSTFDALSPSGQASVGTDPNGIPIVILSGVGWVYLIGSQPRAQTSESVGGATSSEMLVQTYSGTPSKTRYLLVNSSGTATVSLSDGSNSATFTQDHYVDVTNSQPPVLGAVQSYAPTSMPKTKNILAMARAQYALPNPEV